MLPDLSHIDPDLVPILQGLDARITALETPVLVIPPPVTNVITWRPIPTISFRQGVPSGFDVSPFVSNSLGLLLAIRLLGPTLPEGVTFTDPQFNYDGKGPAATVSGFMLTADDGRTP